MFLLDWQASDCSSCLYWIIKRKSRATKNRREGKEDEPIAITAITVLTLANANTNTKKTEQKD